MDRFWITVICFVVAIAIMLFIVWLDSRVSARKRAEDDEYKKWLAEHGFKKKGTS